MLLITELGKTANKREMGSAAPSGSSSSSYTYRATGKIINEQPPIHRLVLHIYIYMYILSDGKDFKFGFTIKAFHSNEVSI